MINITTARAAELSADDELDNPFITGLNRASLSSVVTLSGTAVLTDGARENAVTGTTFDYWMPDVTTTFCTFAMDYGSAISIGNLSIAGHNLGTLGASVRAQYSDDGSTYTTTANGVVAVTDDTPISLRFVAESHRYWRLLVSDIVSGDPVYAAVISFSSEIVFPRRFYQGFAPVISPTEVQLQSNVSVGGNLLGSSVITSGSTMTAAFRLIPPDFLRDNPSFISRFNEGTGIFFAWRPETYPEDIHYCWREGDTLRPRNDGPRDFMAFEMQMRVYEG